MLNKKGIVVKEVIKWVLLVLGIVVMLLVLTLLYDKAQEYFKALLDVFAFGRGRT